MNTKYEENDYTDIREKKIFSKLREIKSPAIIIPNSLEVIKTKGGFKEERLSVQCPFCNEIYKAYKRNLLKGQRHNCQRAIRMKNSFLEKYGVDNPMKNRETQKKNAEGRKKTFIEKYGSLTTKPFMEKRKETIIKKYGVSNVMQDPEILEKRAQTNLKKWGYKCTASSPEVYKKARRRYTFDGISFDSSYEIAVYYFYKKQGIILEREPKTEFFYINNMGKKSNYRPDFFNPVTKELIEVKSHRYLRSPDYNALIYKVAVVISDMDHSLDKYIEVARKDFGGLYWYRQFKNY